jgi:hypothetical protein
VHIVSTDFGRARQSFAGKGGFVGASGRVHRLFTTVLLTLPTPQYADTQSLYGVLILFAARVVRLLIGIINLVVLTLSKVSSRCCCIRSPDTFRPIPCA